MKRNMDLIRQILLAIEDSDQHYGEDSHQLGLDNIAPETLGYHLDLLREAGFISGDDVTGASDVGSTYVGLNLRWAGHDFLDAARDDNRWGRAKATALAAGGISIDVMKALLIEYTKQAVGLGSGGA